MMTGDKTDSSLTLMVKCLQILILPKIPIGVRQHFDVFFPLHTSCLAMFYSQLPWWPVCPQKASCPDVPASCHPNGLCASPEGFMPPKWRLHATLNGLCATQTALCLTESTRLFPQFRWFFSQPDVTCSPYGLIAPSFKCMPYLSPQYITEVSRKKKV